MTTALVQFRSVRTIPVAPIAVSIVPVAALVAAIPIAVVSIVTVMAGRPVAAWAVVHAGGQARACDEQQGSA
jgi:hypothetical protein